MRIMMLALLKRDLHQFLPFAGAGQAAGGTALPMLFFLSIAMLYPFAVGPRPDLLAQTGGGVLWIAALLAAILPAERLIASDVENGVFDQLTVRGIAEEWVMAVRLLAHWLSFGPWLILASFPAAALLGMEADVLRIAVLGLLAGTPGLAAAGLIIAALTASLKGGAALSGLLLIPITLPILIFGAGALAKGDAASLGLAAAVSLVLVAMAPFAAGAAVRAARQG